MALQGPFPTSVATDNAGEGDALMLALNVMSDVWINGGSIRPPIDEQDRLVRAEMVQRFKRLYDRVLFACGDD